MKPTSKLLEKASARRPKYQPPPMPPAVVFTPEFKTWFGSSKVVDRFGDPVVVHHGSPDLRFLKENGMFLQLEERYGRPAPAIPKGFFFVDDYATAKSYADPHRAFDYQNSEPGVESFFLKIENPLIIDNKGERWKHKTENSVETAVKGGHDGIIIKNTIDTYHPSDGKKAATVYVVFDSNQIKSVKNTTFNPAEKSVYASTKIAGLPEWFGDSKIVDSEGNPLPVYHGSNAKFNSFEKKPGIRGDGGIFEETVHSPFKFFSADPAYAWNVARAKGNGIGNVMKVFLKMDHPLDLTTAAGIAKAYHIFDVPVEDERINELKEERQRAEAAPLNTKTRYVKYEGDQAVAESAAPRPGYVEVKWTPEQAAAFKQEELDDLDMELSAAVDARIKEDGMPKSVWDMLDAPDSADKLKAAGYDGVILLENDGTKSFAVPDANQIKATNAKAFDPKSTNVTAKLASPLYVGTPKFKAWFRDSKVVNEDGSPMRVFRGDARGDKLSPSFNPAKATSGRFYFTSDPEIASNYSTSKPYVPEEDEDYYAWFKFPAYKRSNREKYAPNLNNIWYYLSPEEKQRFKQVAQTANFEEEGVTFDGENGPVNSDLLNESLVQRQFRGDWVKAAAESWLRGGTVYNQEEEFGKLFDAAKIPYVYDDPHQLRSVVTAVYLSIQNPIDTSNIPQHVVDKFHEMAKGGRNKVKPSDPQWDKANYSVKDWVEKLDYDLENHTTHAWTVMPEKITKALQSMGYDGIKDTGGKNGGLKHTVWIAFEPNQIKSAISNKNFNPNKKDITAALDKNELVQHRRGFIKPDGEFWAAKPGQEHLEMAAEAGASSGALMDKGYIRFVQKPFSHLELQFCLDKAVAKKNALALMSVIPQYELVMFDVYKMVKGKPEDQNFYGSGTQGAKWLRDVFAGKTPEKPLPLKMAGEKTIFYRGTSQQSKPNGAYWTPSLSFALQFTQSGQESEVQQVSIDTDKTWRQLPELPYGGDLDAIEAVIPEAKKNGCGAIWCSEGPGEPDSIYVFDKALLKGVKPYQSKAKRERKAPTKAPKLKGQPATEPFKEWFGDSKVVDAKGKPAVYYHGTTHDFESFNPDTGNDEGYYGKGIYFTSSKLDASKNYAGEGPDLTNRIETLAEKLYDQGEVEDMEEAKVVAKSKLKGSHEGAVLPCYISLQNPVVVEPKGGTRIEFYTPGERDPDTEDDEDYFPDEEEGPAIYALKDAAEEFHFDPQEVLSLLSDYMYDGLQAYDFEKKIRSGELFDSEEGASNTGCMIAQFYKNMGFDGIIQKNADQEFRGMVMDKGTTHVILWDSSKIKSAIGNKGTFDPNDTRITASYIKHASFLPRKYKFVTDCIHAEGEDIHDMKDKARDVSYATMLRNCEGFGELARNLGYSRDFPIMKDWSVSYCKSMYRGVPCYYLRQSGIEYIFTLHGAAGATPQGDDEFDYIESEPMLKEAARPSPQKLEQMMKPFMKPVTKPRSKEQGGVDIEHEGLTQEDVQRCIEADPSDDLNYVTWIARQLQQKKIRLPEDAGKMREQLTQFTKLKRSPKFKGEKDIQKYDPSSLYRVVNENKTQVSEKEQIRELKTKGRPGAQIVYNRDGMVMYAVTEPEALMELSSNTNWCTTQEDHAKRYLKNDNTIYTIYKNGEPYVQYDPKSNQLMNTEDKDIRDTLPEDADQVFPDLPDSRVVVDPSMIAVIEANPQIFKNIECYDMTDIPDEADACFYYAHYVLNAPYPEGEPFIATSTFYSYEYADKVLKGPFPAGEKVLATDPKLAYDYAVRILKGRFPLAEPLIANSPAAVAYAQNVIKGRWKEAEPEIFSTKGEEHVLYQHAEAAFSYIYGVEEQEPGTDWSAAEPLLAHNSEVACRYAIRVKKARFPEAEFYIWANENTRYNYANAFFNPSAPYLGKGGQWPEDLVKQFEARKAQNVAKSFRRPRAAKLLTPNAVVL